jgi:hypothetical protein
LKLRKKAFGFIAGTMLMIIILVSRFGRHIQPRHSDDIIKVVIETVDDLGKVQTIRGLLRENTDSLESIRFLKCLNKLNFFKSSYSEDIDTCYEKAMEEANINSSSFSEVLFKMKRPLYEMKDNHRFNIGLINLIQDGHYVKFDSAWTAHFKRPSQIDLKYKPLLKEKFESQVEIKRSLDSSLILIKEIKSLRNKEYN